MNNIESFNIENKEIKKFSDLTVFTSTFYGQDQTSKVRQKLAEKLLKNCHDLNIYCVVVDGGSNQEFLDKVKSLKNVTLLIEPSLNMGDSRKEALRLAMEKYNTPYFFWIEPEKDDLIKEESLLSIIKELREEKADMVVPKRIENNTRPELQTWIENRANKKATDIMDSSLEESFDLWFGPKMFNQAGAKYFIDYKSNLNKWDTIIGPVIDAYKGGLKIASVPVDYKYDISQKENEESNRIMKHKRIEQYATILKELGDPYFNKDKFTKDESNNKKL
jgi:hypothetical protein